MKLFSRLIIMYKKKNYPKVSYLRIAICSILFFICANTTYAKGFLFFSWGTETYVVHELPADYIIQTEYGNRHANLGVVYQEFSLFGIPIWNWDVNGYILLPDDYNTMEKGCIVYYNLNAKEFQKIESIVGNLQGTPQLSFWRSYGGKLIFLPFLLPFLLAILSGISEQLGTYLSPSERTEDNNACSVQTKENFQKKENEEIVTEDSTS